jgi:hypothetical protein
MVLIDDFKDAVAGKIWVKHEQHHFSPAEQTPGTRTTQGCTQGQGRRCHLRGRKTEVHHSAGDETYKHGHNLCTEHQGQFHLPSAASGIKAFKQAT